MQASKASPCEYDSQPPQSPEPPQASPQLGKKLGYPWPLISLDVLQGLCPKANALRETAHALLRKTRSTYMGWPRVRVVTPFPYVSHEAQEPRPARVTALEGIWFAAQWEDVPDY